MILAAFPPSDLQPPGLCFLFLLYGGSPYEERRGGGALYIGVLGHEEVSGRRIDANGATRPKRGGPTRPGTGAKWGALFWPSGLRLLASFALRSSSFQKNDPRKFAAHYDVVKALK